MILVDSSIWMDHLRSADDRLIQLLQAEQVLMHPFVVGELMVGSLRRRHKLLIELKQLPLCIPADDDDVLTLIEASKLYSTGVSYIDVHLLAATLITPNAKLWTNDKALYTSAATVGVAFKPTLIH